MAFAVGCMMADAARQELRRGRAEDRRRGLLATNLFNIFFFSWIPAYLLMNYFGWETAHMVWHADSIAAYPFYLPIFLVVFFASGNLGFLLGAALVQRGATRANRGVYLGILGTCAIWFFAHADRTFRLGTYSEWKAGSAPWLHEDPVFVGVSIASTLVFCSGLAAFALWLARPTDAGPPSRERRPR
ncbi:hypothetical protein [Sorangium sp. So ce388]|uniref:hypothetical protein n=1 Tax=Sorangium sp. So ce388 TaxID=3133309 RepID=UPI003F5C385A